MADKSIGIDEVAALLKSEIRGIASAGKEAGGDFAEEFMEAAVGGVKKHSKELKSEIAKVFDDFNRKTNNFKSRKTISNAEWSSVLALSKELMKSERYVDSIREKLSNISVTFKGAGKISGIDKILDEFEKGSAIESVLWSEAGKNYKKKKPTTRQPKVEVPVVSADPAPVVKAEEKKQEAIRETTDALQEQQRASERAEQAQEKLNNARKNASRIKVREFTKEEHEAYLEKYEKDHGGSVESAEETVDIIRQASQFGTKFETDMITACKRATTAVKRFFESIDVDKYPGLAGWKDSILESVKNGYFSDKSTLVNGLNTGEYSWGVEALDDNRFYVYLNLLDVAKDKESEFSAHIEAESKKRDEGIEKEIKLYASLNEAYEKLSNLRKNEPEWDNTDYIKSYKQRIEYYEKERALMQEILGLEEEFKSIPGKYRNRAVSDIGGIAARYRTDEVTQNSHGDVERQIQFGQRELIKLTEEQTQALHEQEAAAKGAAQAQKELNDAQQAGSSKKSLEDEFNNQLRALHGWRDLAEKVKEQVRNSDVSNTREVRKNVLSVLKDVPDDVATLIGDGFVKGLKNGFKGVKTQDILDMIHPIVNEAGKGTFMGAPITEMFELLDGVDLKSFNINELLEQAKLMPVMFKPLFEILQKIANVRKEETAAMHKQEQAADAVVEAQKKVVDVSTDNSVTQNNQRQITSYQELLGVLQEYFSLTEKITRSKLDGSFIDEFEKNMPDYSASDLDDPTKRLAEIKAEFKKTYQMLSGMKRAYKDGVDFVDNDNMRIHHERLREEIDYTTTRLAAMARVYMDLGGNIGDFNKTQQKVVTPKLVRYDKDSDAFAAEARELEKINAPIEAAQNQIRELLQSLLPVLSDTEKLTQLMTGRGEWGAFTNIISRLNANAGIDMIEPEYAAKKLAEIFGFEIPQAIEKAENAQAEFTAETEDTASAQNKLKESVKDTSNLLYHAGDLSNPSKTQKTYPLGHVRPSKSDGVFNGFTGLYTTEDVDGFWGNEWHGAPISTIDASQYKLFDVRTDELATKAKEFFDSLNGTIYGYIEDFATGEIEKLTDVKSIDELWANFQEVFKNTNMTFEEFAAFVKKAQALVSGKDFSYIEGLPDLDQGIVKTGEKSALQGVSKEVFNSDSFQTQLLKMLGFEGIDLRGTKHNGTYTGGTVLFDVKPESIKSVNENWSDVMTRHGYEIDEDDLRREEKRRQLAFDTANAYSQQAESAEKAKKSLQDVLDLASKMSTESGDADAFNARHSNLLDRARDLTSNADYDQIYNQLIASESKYQQEVEETNRIEAERQKQFDEFAPSAIQILGDESVPHADREKLFTEFTNQILQGEMVASDALERLSNAMGELRQQSASMPDDIINDFGAENETVAETVSQLQKLSSVDITRIFDSVDLKDFLETFNIDKSNFATFRTLFEELMRITKAMSDGVDVGNVFDVKMAEITDTIMRLGGHMMDLDDSGYATMMQDFYKHMSSTKIQFDGSIKAEYTKDQWKALYNAYKGRLTSDVTKGISADSLYEELADKWPSLFPEDLDDKDRFKLIFDKLDEARQLQVNNWKVLQGFVSGDRAGIQGSVDDIYNKMNNALYADESTDSINLEDNAFQDVAQSAEKAAKAKEKFDRANQKVKSGADQSADSLDDEADSMARVVAATPPDSKGWDTVTQYKAGDNDEPNAIRRTRTVRADDSNRQFTETLTLNENGEWETAGSTQTDNYRIVRQEELNALYRDREHCLTNILRCTKEIDNADTEAGRNAAREVLALEQERLATINESIEAYGDLVSQQKLDAQDDKLVVKTRDHEQQRYIDMTEDERAEAVNAALQRRQSILNNIAKLERQRNGAGSDQEREAINAIIATEQERARIVAREIDLYESVNAAQKVQQQDAKAIEKARQQQQQQTIADTKRATKEQERLSNEQAQLIENTYDEYLSAQKNIQKFNLDLSGKEHTDQLNNEQQKLIQAQEKLLSLGVDVAKISDSDVLSLQQKEKLLEKEAKHRRDIHDLIVSASDKERDMQKKADSEAISPYKKNYDKELEALKKVETNVRSFGEKGVSGELQSQIVGYKKLVGELGDLNTQLNANPALAKDEKFAKHYDDVALKAAKARTEIEGVFKESQKLQKIGSLIAVNDGDFSNVAHLKTAMIEFANSVLDGEVKIQGFNGQGTEMYATLQKSTGAVENITVALDKASGNLQAFNAGTSRATNEWEDFKTQAVAGAKNLIGMYVGFQEGVQAVRSGLNYVKEIDLAMTELKKVTNETDASYKEFLKDAGSTSAVIGSTISDFTEATATFARLGYSMEESSSMAETAIIYKNVADGLDSVEESSDSIISTMMAFGIEANDTMSIIDRFNAVGNAFAITSAGIGEALQRSASALFSAGNTIDESVALVTAANSVIQNPEQVGTALKTLALRLRGAKTELEDASLDVEGMAENTSTLQAKLKALTHGKVDIMLDADTFKSTTQILREMSGAWEDMTDIERASALELMGGKRQANILSSVITNFETVEDVIETSMNSSGSAIAENEKWLDSIEGKTYQFTNALQTMWSNMLNSEVIKGFIDFGTDAIQFLDTGVGKVIALVAALKLMAKYKGFSFGGIVKGLGDNIKAITTAQQKLQALSSVTKVAGPLPTESINAYAQAVAGLTAKQQANLLASQNLTKTDIQRVLQTNQCTEAEQREALAHVHTATTKQQETAASQALFVAKTQEMAATYRNNAMTLQGAAASEAAAAANLLEEAACKKATKADLLEMVNKSNLTAATKQQIVAELGLTGAKKAGEAANYGLLASIKALYASNPIGWILAIISAVISLVSWLVSLRESTEELSQAAEDAISKYNQSTNSLRDQKETLDELSSAYEKLSKGVDLNTNENISLTTDAYEEYLDVCNDIADMYPHLVTGFDAQGNAILSLRGNVEALTQAYNDAAQAARQELISRGGKVFDAFTEEYDDSYVDAFDPVPGLKQQREYAQELYDAFASGDKDTMQDVWDELDTNHHLALEHILEESGIEFGDVRNWAGTVKEENAEEISRKLLSFVKSTTTQINTETSKVKSLMSAYLGEDLDYTKLGQRSKAVIDSIVSSLDAEFISGFDSADALYNHIKTNIVSAFKDSSVVDTIDNLSALQLKFDDGDISYADYKKQLSEYLGKIQNKFDEKSLTQIKIGLGIDEESLQTSVNHIQTLLGNDPMGPMTKDLQDKINSLSVEDLQIAGELEVEDGVLYTWDELLAKIKEVKATLGTDVTVVKTYSALAESAESYNDILSQTSEIVTDNTEVTQEYKDSLIELGVSEEDLADCFDEANPLIVKNAKALNNLVKATSKNIANNVKLAKSQARLEYYDLVKQLHSALDGTKKLDSATRDSVYSTIAQIDAVQKALYQYQLLEDTLLGVNNAFKEFNEAKEIDDLNTYGDSYVEMVQTMYDGLYKTGKVGTEQFWAAVEHLVPTEVYQGLKEDSDRMKAIYDYYNKKILPSLHLEEDQFSMDYASIENFVKKAIDAKVFTGDRKDFDLVEGMNLEEAAKRLEMTKAQAYAFFAELDKYNTSSTEPSFLSQLDDSLEGRITKVSNKIEDLNKQKLALLEDGGYDKNEKAIKKIDKQIKEAGGDLESLGQEAYTTWQNYTKNDAALASIEEISDKSQMLSDVWPEELITSLGLTGEMTVEEAYNRLLQKQLKLEEPTVLTAQLAIENIDTQIANLEAKLKKAEEDPTVLGVKVDASDAEVEEAKQKVKDQIQALQEDKVAIATTFGIELSEEDKKDLEDELNAIEKFKINDKEFTVRAKGTSEVMRLLEAVNKYAKDVTKTVTTEYKTVYTSDNKQYSGWTHTPGSGGRYTHADGTVHADGAAHATGSWGAPRTETALVGELGPELLVRNGRWYTIGDNGAEFTQVQRGDIIFNHKQTEDLLSKGYVTGRGKLQGGSSAFASGTAYSGTWRPTSPNKEQSNKPGNDFTKTGNKLFDAADSLSTAAGSVSDSADEFREVFDWIEVRLEEINERIDLKNAQLENKVGHSAQNNVIDSMIDLNQKLYNNLIAGANKYYAYAEKLLAKVPKAYRDAAQDGTIAIEEFVGKTDEKTLEAIQEYREWVQKGADLTQQAEETLTEISTLAKQAIDNIASDYENKKSLRDNKIDQYDAYNSLLETDKGFESTSVYQAMIAENNKNIATLQQQRDKMQTELNKRVQSGEIKKYSQDWYDAVNDIAAVDTEIIELTTDTENYQDAINELHWDKFDALMKRIEHVSDETENLIDILNNKDVVDEGGIWTEEGITSLGLYAQQMEAAEVQAKKYEEEIKYLNKNWQKLGYTEEEYIDKLDELKSGQYDAIQAYHDSKDAIVDLNKERVDAIKEGIEKEIEAYEELIEKKKEELDAEKDLYDFQKSVMEQEKDIADLDRQLAALAADNSASARAKRAQLEAELAEANAALQDSYYERSVSNQQEALDKELENFQDEKNAEIEGWDQYLENTEQVIADSLATIQANTDVVYQTLQAMVQEYGLNIKNSITSAIIDPWAEGSTAIQSFSEQFGISMSATVEELESLAIHFKETMLEIEQAGVDATNVVKENAKGYTAAEYQEPKKEEPKKDGNKKQEEQKTIKVGGKINASGAKIYDYAGDTKGEKQYYSSDPIYTVLEEKSGYLRVRHHKSSKGTTGWFKKSDVKAYAKGSKGIGEDQWALIDELGDELVLRAQNGRITYMEKGTGVVPADLTSNLMEWGKLDPSIILDQNRPQFGVHPEINNTQIQIDNSIGELIHIDKCDQGTLPDVEKIVNQALEKHTQRLNQSLRKYTR